MLAHLNPETQKRIDASDATLALWKSNADGTPANGGDTKKREAGMTEEVAGPLELCSRRALHATMKPWKWHGARLWVVALHGEVQDDGDKMGALKREILAEITPNPFR